MKKFGLVLLSIIVMGSMIGCHKVEMTEMEKERTEFVKKTILGYGMEIAAEVTPDTLEENKKSTDDIVSFGKKQIYELSCGMQNDMESNTLFYHKFESSKGGKSEAEKLFNELKNSIKVLPDSITNEKIDSETGNKSFTSRSKTSNSTETVDSTEDGETSIAKDTVIITEILVVLIFDAEKYEVAQMTSYVRLPLNNVDAMTDKEMKDMGWTY
jgi:hypothetical protein